jgi:bifunctional DNase/RNase
MPRGKGKEDKVFNRCKKIHWNLAVVALALYVIIFFQTGAEAEEKSPFEYLDVRVKEVLRDPRTKQPMVLLTDDGDRRGMLIWIGEAEARALEAARQDIVPHRPMTHDLLTNILKRLNAQLTEVRITELKDNVYYARMHLRTREGEMEIDARPSDTMVLALQAGVPIRVSSSLFTEQSFQLDLSPLEAYGLEVQELSDDLKAALGYEGDGLLIAQVEPGSVADQAGIRREDILVKAMGKPLRQVKDLLEALSGVKSELEVQIHRDGRLLSKKLPVHSSQ